MKDLTEGSVTSHLLHMSAFMAVSMAVQTLYLLADLYWVGRLGKEAIAAVGVAGNLTMIVLALTQMLGVGTTTLISHAAGQKRSGAGRASVQPIFPDVDPDSSRPGRARIFANERVLRFVKRR